MSDLESAPETENLLPSHQPEEPHRRRRGQNPLLVHGGLVLLMVAVVVAAAIGAYAFIFGGGGSGSGVNGKLASALRRTTTTTAAPTTTTHTVKPKPKGPAEPKIVKLPDLGANALHIGSTGPVVLAYEYRLKQLHFDPGPVDGVYDQATAYAVQAVEKLYGVTRDGEIGPGVRFALSTFKWPKPGVTKNAEPDRVEINLDDQVLTLYRGGHIQLITTTSTGSGHGFCGGSDGCQYALTPAGKYSFQWKFQGWDEGKLGKLYNPFYFNGGIAVHGYPDVPAYPASHGCARIPMHIANYFQSLVWKGMPVYVLGQTIKPIGPLPKPPPPTTTTVAPTTTTVKAGKGKKPTTTTTAKPKATTTTASPHHP